MKKKSEIPKTESGEFPLKNIIVILLVVILMGLGVSYLFYDSEDKITTLGEKVCNAYNMTFDYTSGEYTHCYVLDDKTGIKHPFDFWMDIESCSRIYADKPVLTSDDGTVGVYLTDNNVNLDKGCTKGAGVFNISGNATVCYHCVNESEKINDSIPAGSWLCPI